MSPTAKRLTRAESQERTRKLIVEAAARLFLRDGFRATSLEQVGEEAGFTRGAVYSNFESKTAMGIAVIDELYDGEVRKLEATLQTLEEEGMDAWFDALAAWADATVGDPAWMRLEIEIAAFSANEESYRQATAARYERLRRRCAELIDERFAGAFPVPSETLAIAFIGLGLGVGAQRAADPSLSGSATIELLRSLALLPR